MMAVDEIEAATASPRQLALLRIRLLEDSGDGLPTLVAALLQESLRSFLVFAKSVVVPIDGKSVAEAAETLDLYRILTIVSNLARQDTTLAEELGRQGVPGQLSSLVLYDIDQLTADVDQDAVIELQDLACEVLSFCTASTRLPFSREELQQRLPLVFEIESLPDETETKKAGSGGKETVLIHQVTARQSAQADVGFGESLAVFRVSYSAGTSTHTRFVCPVMWPSAVVLSQWLVSNPAVIEGRSVMEIGAGCGLVGLVAARIQQGESAGVKVLMSDFNRTVLANLQRNVVLNSVAGQCEVVGLDFYDQTGTSNHWKDMNGHQRDPVDIVLAADMICQADDAFVAANTIHDTLRPGGKAFAVCADASHRFGVDYFLQACERVQLEVEVKDVNDLYSGKLLSKSLQQTSGYVEGMQLKMFFLTKPVQ